MGHQNNEAADRAVGKNKKKSTEALTTEQRISNVRKNVEAGLYVPVTEVKLLLEQYDEAVAAREDIAERHTSRAGEAVAELESIPRG